MTGFWNHLVSFQINDIVLFEILLSNPGLKFFYLQYATKYFSQLKR